MLSTNLHLLLDHLFRLNAREKNGVVGIVVVERNEIDHYITYTSAFWERCCFTVTCQPRHRLLAYFAKPLVGSVGVYAGC
jgi:hypothetical protein